LLNGGRVGDLFEAGVDNLYAIAVCLIARLPGTLGKILKPFVYCARMITDRMYPQVFGGQLFVTYQLQSSDLITALVNIKFSQLSSYILLAKVDR
jgi:hypothetical protein